MCIFITLSHNWNVFRLWFTPLEMCPCITNPEWGEECADSGHGKGWGAVFLLHTTFYYQDWNSSIPGPKDQRIICRKENLPLVEGDQVREPWRKLDKLNPWTLTGCTSKCWGTSLMSPWNCIWQSLHYWIWIIGGWRNWSRTSVIAVFTEGKEDLGNSSIPSVPGGVMESFILEAICRHRKDSKVMSGQHEFTTGMSCLTDLIILHDKMPGLLFLLPSALCFHFLPCIDIFHAHCIPWITFFPVLSHN